MIGSKRPSFINPPSSSEDFSKNNKSEQFFYDQEKDSKIDLNDTPSHKVIFIGTLIRY